MSLVKAFKRSVADYIMSASLLFDDSTKSPKKDAHYVLTKENKI